MNDQVLRKSYSNLRHGRKQRTGKNKYTCEKCDRKFFSYYLLMKHSFGKHNTPITCEDCRGPFPTIRKFRAHIKRNHRSNESRCTKMKYSCKSCYQEFTRYCLLADHTFMHHDIPVKCMKCSDLFTTLKDYKKHMKKGHQANPKVVDKRENLPCPHCGITYSDKYSLTYHIKRIHEEHEKKKCPECD